MKTFLSLNNPFYKDNRTTTFRFVILNITYEHSKELYDGTKINVKRIFFETLFFTILFIYSYEILHQE